MRRICMEMRAMKGMKNPTPASISNRPVRMPLVLAAKNAAVSAALQLGGGGGTNPATGHQPMVTSRPIRAALHRQTSCALQTDQLCFLVHGIFLCVYCCC